MKFDDFDRQQRQFNWFFAAILGLGAIWVIGLLTALFTLGPQAIAVFMGQCH